MHGLRFFQERDNEMKSSVTRAGAPLQALNEFSWAFFSWESDDSPPWLSNRGDSTNLGIIMDGFDLTPLSSCGGYEFSMTFSRIMSPKVAQLFFFFSF